MSVIPDDVARRVMSTPASFPRLTLNKDPRLAEHLEALEQAMDMDVGASFASFRRAMEDLGQVAQQIAQNLSSAIGSGTGYMPDAMVWSAGEDDGEEAPRWLA